ncbi:2-oxo acid dehydrogenase subunit E2 [Psychrobacter sp.]|uniref:2-oxo acid dehydrogenase subunit E2 n=1 Tax=Psychrobacter sp. TaxID=56811 RepID=UPI0025FCBC11|nr:2-oxo acid dehydrogenase subunit E2 [Psychrobacter sp.]
MEIKAPDLGVESAEVSEIMVSIGDKIQENDNIVLLESDKAAVEVPSSSSGTVTKINVSVGDTVSEGSVLIEIEADSDDASDTQSTVTEVQTSQNATSDSDNQHDMDKTTQHKINTTDQDDDNSSGSTVVGDEAGQSKTYSLPDLGVEVAEVADIMVSVGDSVEANQSILLIESDKASVEVPSPVSGTVEEILISAGDKVTNGQDFIVINIASDDSHAETEVKKDHNAKNTQQDNKDVNLAPASSVESKHKQVANASKSRNPQLQSNFKSKPSITQDHKLSEQQINAKLSDVYAGPAVRKLARQLGVDITQISGTALNDRIVKEDIFDYVKGLMQSNDANTVAQNTVPSGLPNLPDMSNLDIWGEIETQDLSRLQKVSIPQLNYNTYLPQVTQFDLSDITDTESLRATLKGEFKAQGIGLTILAFIVKATAYALLQYPRFNSHLSDDNTKIYLRKTVNMGIAVATDDGLIVPVIKDAQTKGIKQLAIEIGELAAKARDKKLGTKELQGASFTISSQGNLGGTYFTPLVNWPQVSILGVSEASMQPRWNAEKQVFDPRLMLPLSLSYDHRVINGADAAVFTRYIAKLLADPRRILL